MIISSFKKGLLITLLSVSTLANLQASDFKSICLGFGPSIDLSAPYIPLVHIQDPYIYNFENNKLDNETEFVYEEYQSCIATSAGFLASQTESLATACEEEGGIARESSVESNDGIIPVRNGFRPPREMNERQMMSCAKGQRNATLDEILDGNRDIIPLEFQLDRMQQRGPIVISF